MGYIGMCGIKGYVFFRRFDLVISRVSILAILVVLFWHSSLDMGMFLRRSYFFIIIDKTISKIPSQIMFTAIQHWSELEKN